MKYIQIILTLIVMLCLVGLVTELGASTFEIFATIIMVLGIWYSGYAIGINPD